MLKTSQNKTLFILVLKGREGYSFTLWGRTQTENDDYCSLGCDPEDGGITFLRHVRYMASHLRGQ
jgi:hypothetical protein